MHYFLFLHCHCILLTVFFVVKRLSAPSFPVSIGPFSYLSTATHSARGAVVKQQLKLQAEAKKFPQNTSSFQHVEMGRQQKMMFASRHRAFFFFLNLKQLHYTKWGAQWQYKWSLSSCFFSFKYHYWERLFLRCVQILKRSLRLRVFRSDLKKPHHWKTHILHFCSFSTFKQNTTVSHCSTRAAWWWDETLQFFTEQLISATGGRQRWDLLSKCALMKA